MVKIERLNGYHFEVNMCSYEDRVWYQCYVDDLVIINLQRCKALRSDITLGRIQWWWMTDRQCYYLFFYGKHKDRDKVIDEDIVLSLIR